MVSLQPGVQEFKPNLLREDSDLHLGVNNLIIAINILTNYRSSGGRCISSLLELKFKGSIMGYNSLELLFFT